jgi:hypothetical protein
MTSEQRNRIKRERYAELQADKKQIVLDKAAIQYSNLTQEQKDQRKKSQRIPTNLSASSASPLKNTTDEKAQKMRDRHTKAFQTRMTKLEEWRKERDGLFPWPSLVRRMRTTELYLKVIQTHGGVCKICSGRIWLPFLTRLTALHDPLAFVPFKDRDLRAVLKNPEKYAVLCTNCAFKVRLLSFCRVFSPEPYNRGVEPGMRECYEAIKAAYPQDDKLLRGKIIRGEIKSLTQSFNRMGDDKPVPSIVRLNPFHTWVLENPPDLVGDELARLVRQSEGSNRL